MLFFFSFSAVVTTLAGSANGVPGYQDGVGSEALFFFDAAKAEPAEDWKKGSVCVDDDGNVIQEQEQTYKNVYERFLSFVRNYERNGVSDADDHDIFCMTTEEFQGIADALRDGDYIFVMEDGVNCQ